MPARCRFAASMRVWFSVLMAAVSSKRERLRGAPSLFEYRRRYPLTVANFGALNDREAWLDRLWELDVRWRERLEDERRAKEVIVRGAPPAELSVEGEFEIIYAGGVWGLLHAAVMSCRYNRRVMVFDAGAVGHVERDWNISDDELRALEAVGLFNKDEIEAAVVNSYRSGFVKFHDAGSRVKTPPLWMEGVLNVAIAPNKLLASASHKLEASETKSALMSGQRFVRCYVQPSRVAVEVEDARTKRRSLYPARLFVDATGAESVVARQLNEDRALTHVCPTVGTISRGLVRGAESNQVDFSVGEILVSNEDARDHRQLIWEGFAGSHARGEYATYLFFYDAVDSPADKSLLALFERYFETLPRYKRMGAQWRVTRPLFGYVPGFQHHGWMGRKRTSEDRIMLIGDAAGFSSPLTFSGLGPHMRDLARLTHLAHLALEADLLDAASLSEISASEPRLAQVATLAE